jgi:DNA repair photolyase
MVSEVDAKSILITYKNPSSWFGVKYGMNIYRGCQHGCIYCDSRSECYQIDKFEDIIVKKMQLNC